MRVEPLEPKRLPKGLCKPRTARALAYCFQIPKNELGELNKRGFGHFLTHKLLHGSRLGQKWRAAQTPKIRVICRVGYRWISSDVLLHNQGHSALILT